MKIIVIGLGSMGKRRIRLISEHKDVELYGIDSQESRCNEVKEKFGIECYSSIDEACNAHSIEAAIISTSPLSHSGIIKDCLLHNLHVFTEINLVQDGYEDNIALAKERGKVLFLSSTFLYREENLIIIDKVNNANCPLNYTYHVGQYLPDWHPWESYNNYFIGNPKTNGCREIMAIDLPWIVTAFGPIKNVYSLKSKMTNLNVNYDDNYIIVLEHENGTKGVFVVDVVARKPYRHFEVYGETLQIRWDGEPDTLYEYDIENKKDVRLIQENKSEHIEGYAAYIDENPYREELSAFLSLMVNPSNRPIWGFEDDYKLLNWINKIES